MKTARFSDLVEAAGRPSPHTIWVDPKDDPELQRAIKGDRVLTVHQANVGQSKDFGTVGYKADPQAQFLIFPKSLKRFLDRRVVGINYEKVETPPLQRAKPKEKAVNRSTPTRHEKPDTAEKAVAHLTPKTEPPAAHESPHAKAEEPPHSGAKSPAPEAAAPENVSIPGEALSSKEILKEVRAVLKALEGGKSVPAYRRLQGLAEQLEASNTPAGKKR